MAQVRWTRRALEDVDAICGYIALDSPSFADLFGRQLIAATRRLADFPLSGRVVPEIEDQAVREILVQPYRLIYRVHPDRVSILAVHHGARLLLGPDEEIAEPPPWAPG